jgi:tRNASer (uridine44-2'-O)-methyltransferase
MTNATTMLRSEHGVWKTDSNYKQACPNLSEAKFAQVSDLLLENPNLNSTHLFRADIIFDSSNILKTGLEKERAYGIVANGGDEQGANHERERVTDPISLHDETEEVAAPVIVGAILKRRVLRKLIPRKPQVDPPLEQWCYLYDLSPSPTTSGRIVIYTPRIESGQAMPWYHPPVKSLAYLYETRANETSLSMHFLHFAPDTQVPDRLHRTFISLLQTFLRLAKNPTPEPKVVNGLAHDATRISMAPSALKDTILPQHTVQDTYSRLKQRYASDLVSRWVEKTEPSKHVFEDLSIAAFVIELWRQMYDTPADFPGFVDIACGNGVLSYILIKEGYVGRGFDARRRKTWEVLGMDEFLDEMICIPHPFLATFESNIDDLLPGARVHDGVFKPGTFIISNHADELTPWTPLLATLSSPRSPLPFLAIPCCSHALSGAKHRYSPKDIHLQSPDSRIHDSEEQPATGDLKALRAEKMNAAHHSDDKSMYACLTRKVVNITEEVGLDAEVTLMRIPSTRNIGIVGNRRKAATKGKEKSLEAIGNVPLGTVELGVDVQRIVARECAMSGGVRGAAQTWVDRAQKLQTGKGRGKVNLGGKSLHD